MRKTRQAEAKTLGKHAKGAKSTQRTADAQGAKSAKHAESAKCNQQAKNAKNAKGAKFVSSSAASPKCSERRHGAHAAAGAATAVSKRATGASAKRTAKAMPTTTVRQAASVRGTAKDASVQRAAGATMPRRSVKTSSKRLAKVMPARRSAAQSSLLRPCKKMATMLASVVLVLAFGVGGVYAWLSLATSSVENTFMPGSVSCQVNETFDGTEKENVTVENTGNVPAYMRAAIVVNWVDANGNVYGAAPVAGTDYTLTLGSDWTVGSDGLYYCSNAIASGASSGNLIDYATRLTNAPSGYSLSINVLAEAIQAEGGAADSAWPNSPWSN